MKILVAYDSSYGNTEKIAKTISEATGGTSAKIGDAGFPEISDFGLIVAGSPTHGGMPTPAMKGFLAALPAAGLKNVKVAAFDTRTCMQEHNIILRGLVDLLGYAAPRIASQLQKKGGRQAAAPEGFLVNGKEGPLNDGEVERARAWAARLRKWAEAN